MSHLLPIAPIKTYLCKQEPWPNDWLGACLQRANCLKPGMPNHRGPLCPSQVTGSAESRDRLPEAAVLAETTWRCKHKAHLCWNKQNAFLHRGESE